MPVLRVILAILVCLTAGLSRAENAPATGYSAADYGDGYQAPAAQFNSAPSNYPQESYRPEQPYYQDAGVPYQTPNHAPVYEGGFASTILGGDDVSVAIGWLTPGLFLAAGVVLLAMLGVVTISWMPIRTFSLPSFNKFVDEGARALGEIKSSDDLVRLMKDVEEAIQKGKRAYEEMFTTAL